MTELAKCPFCGKPFIFAEITDPGIELRHESDECPINGFIGWFSSKEEAMKSKWFNRPIEDKLVIENTRLQKKNHAQHQIIKTLGEHRDICFECFDILDDDSKEIRENIVRAENKKLLSALISMCDQYLQQSDGTLFHLFMSAGEEATELLEDMGYLTCDGRENYSWTDKRKNE